MKNQVKAKQKRTIIVSLVLCAALLACSLFIIIDELVHLNAAYHQFKDVNFAKAYAYALGYDSYRDLKQADLDKVESLRCLVQVGYDENKALYAIPMVELGFKEVADQYITGEEATEESKEEVKKAAATTTDEATGDEASKNSVVFQCIISKASDLTLFKNLRVLYLYDYYDIDLMQQSCNQVYQTFINDYYSSAIYGSTQSYNDYVTFDELIHGSKNRGIRSVALSDLKSLDQLASLTKLEHLSLEYTG
ncbi:MAG: hypothetical protein IKZ23_02100, partial [Clostridia bacterium]|nr:hypothetical protein [Clostridia bacterium]